MVEGRLSGGPFFFPQAGRLRTWGHIPRRTLSRGRLHPPAPGRRGAPRLPRRPTRPTQPCLPRPTVRFATLFPGNDQCTEIFLRFGAQTHCSKRRFPCSFAMHEAQICAKGLPKAQLKHIKTRFSHYFQLCLRTGKNGDVDLLNGTHRLYETGYSLQKDQQLVI